MKIYINFLFFLIFFTSCLLNNTLAANYPKSKGEQRREALGSITDAEGLFFRPSRIQNDETKNPLSSSVNKYLWKASLEVLKTTPLASIDSNSGVIITDWYSPKGKQNYNYKINIFIKDDKIAPEAIEVRVYEQKISNGNISSAKDNSNLSNILEDKILKKARSLYIQSNKEKTK